MEKRSDWARNVETGVPAPEATVAVYLHGTNTLATLYSDDGVTPMANPLTAAVDTGVYGYYAANGRYDETVTPASGDGDAYSVTDILLYDPED